MKTTQNQDQFKINPKHRYAWFFPGGNGAGVHNLP